MKTFIVFLGVDGSGKSTLINGLLETIPDSLMFHFCPTSRYNNNNIKNKTPHSEKEYPILISFFKMLFLLLQFNFGYFLNIKLNPKKIIILDRYIYDIYIDPKRYKIKLSSKIIKILSWLVWPPQYVFVCIGDPKIIAKRKDEISLYEIIKQQKKLISIAKRRKNWVILNTTKNSKKKLLEKIKFIIGVNESITNS